MNLKKIYDAQYVSLYKKLRMGRRISKGVTNYYLGKRNRKKK